MTDWQPIETAPRDGTEIDLWVQAPPNQLSSGSYGRVTDCWFAFDEWRCWDVFDAETVTVHNATHWMRRPGPPQDARGRTEREAVDDLLSKICVYHGGHADAPDCGYCGAAIGSACPVKWEPAK